MVLGLQTKWRMRLELDATRAQNWLCLINDCANVPGYDNQPNVAWLECEDRCVQLPPNLQQPGSCVIIRATSSQCLGFFTLEPAVKKQMKL